MKLVSIKVVITGTCSLSTNTCCSIAIKYYVHNLELERKPIATNLPCVCSTHVRLTYYNCSHVIYIQAQIKNNNSSKFGKETSNHSS